MGGSRLHDRVPALKRRTDEIAALLGRWPGMSFFAAPTMVKRLAGDPAIAEADLFHLKTVIYGGAPMCPADLEGALAVFGPRLARSTGRARRR